MRQYSVVTLALVTWLVIVATGKIEAHDLCDALKVSTPFNVCQYFALNNMEIDTPARPPIYRKIRTNEYMDYLQASKSERGEVFLDANRWIDEQARLAPTVEDVEIPVVFHVLYTDSEDKITEDQAMSQIEALNRDFQGKGQLGGREGDKDLGGEGFDQGVVNANIRFCLATEDQEGVQAKGVQYYEGSTREWTYKDERIKDKRDGGATPWDSERYLNIWVASLDAGVSGYAQMPGGAREMDGIVIDYKYLGTRGKVQHPFDQGKTLTHLIGNYLGVHSLWSMVPCGDDKVEDTPIHNAPNFGCPGAGHISICYGNPVEMTMNYMDNTDDACMYMFTQGQRNRMHAALMEGGPRAGLAKGKTYCKEKLVEEDIEIDIDQEVITSDAYLRVYPNPAPDYFKLESGQLTDQSMRVEIRDAFGRKIWEHASMQSNAIMHIDCSKWSSGVYFVYVNQKVDRPVQKILVP